MNWFLDLFSQISSEIAVFVYCFAIGIYGAIIPNFLLQKVCSPDVEAALDQLCNNTNTLLEAADITTTRSTLREFVPVLVLLLAGSWRDATGRNKPLMFSALIGEVVGVSIQLFAAWKWTVSPWVASISESVLYGLSGGSKLFYVAATCAITDHSSPKNRTTRLAFYQAAAYTGSCLSSGVSGYCLQFLGYKWFFSTVIGLHLLAITFVIFMKKDKVKQNRNEKTEIFQKMKAVCKSRPNNLVVWLMLISCVIINVSAGAETNLYLYYLQQAFDFSVKEAGVYSGFRLMFGVISITALSPLFTKVLKWSDFKVGIVSSTVTFVSAVSMAFAQTVPQLIAFALLDFLKIFVYTLPMSIVTKCVKSDEVGVFVSLRFIGGCLLPIVVFYIYDFIFSLTSHTKPGAFFLASAAIAFIVLMCFCTSSCIYKEPENNSCENSLTTKVEVVNIRRQSSNKPEFIKNCNSTNL